MIASGIADKGLHLTVTSVACPVSSGFHPGQEFECVATASDGSTAKVRVDVQADGTYTWVILG